MVPVLVLDPGITDSFSGVLISTAAGLKWAPFGTMPVIVPVSLFFWFRPYNPVPGLYICIK